jgi:hypothetical protein
VCRLIDLVASGWAIWRTFRTPIFVKDTNCIAGLQGTKKPTLLMENGLLVSLIYQFFFGF